MPHQHAGIIIDIDGKCQYEGCQEPATCIAAGRTYLETPGHDRPGVYCKTHAEEVAHEGIPEYRVACPNCGCEFGIG